MANAPALSVAHLTVRYEGQTHPAVEDVSFTLAEGKIAILIGPNGSGKSTVLKAILGLARSSGEVTVFGKPIAGSHGALGYVPQRPPFDLSLPLTVREAVRMPLLGAHDERAEANFRHFTEILRIDRVLDSPLSSLSGGQLKRALIARAMVTAPRLLLLDEPEAEVDIGGERTLYGMLDEMAEHHKLTVLVCSHELELVHRYADQVLCINRRLMCSGPPETVLTAESLAGLYGATIGLYRHDHGGARR
jgi:zinc transport system ATP-binding protein